MSEGKVDCVTCPVKPFCKATLKAETQCPLLMYLKRVGTYNVGEHRKSLDYWETDIISFIDSEVEKIEQEYGVSLHTPEYGGYIGMFDASSLKEWKRVASGWCLDLSAELLVLGNTIRLLEEGVLY